MVMRDQGPRNTIGFGISHANLPVRNEEERADPNAGAIANYLENRPVQKFFASAAATMVGFAVAGSVAKKGGVAALRGVAKRAAQNPESYYNKSLKVFRETQSILDEIEGIKVRRKGLDDYGLGRGRVYDNPADDEVILRDNFYISASELNSGDSVAEWTLRDEMRQKLVRSARRLPYELPGAYVSQRAISDHLLGNEPEDAPDWSNPLDIVGDFAEQSVKNLAFAFLPFEGAVAGASHGWRKALTSGADANYHGIQKVARNTVVDVNRSLKLLGHEFSDMTARAVRYSRNTTGAAANAIVDASTKQRGLVDTLNLVSKLGKDQGSLASGVREYGRRLRAGEEVFSPLGQAIDVGRGFARNVRSSSGAAALPDETVYKSKFEQLVDSVSRMQYRGSRLDMDSFRQGTFYREMADQEYRSMLSKSLARLGVDEDVARRFTREADQIQTPAGKDATLANRIRFGGTIHGDDFSHAFREKINPVYGKQGDVIADNIEEAVRRADSSFSANKNILDVRARRAWNEAYKNVIAPQARGALGTRKAAFADFDGPLNASQREFLVRRSAERMGIQTRLQDGSLVSTAQLRSQIDDLGVNSRNSEFMRNFLIDKGDISKPWNPFGGNIFGFRAVSVGEALDSGKFEGRQNVSDIQRFARTLGQSDWDPTILNRVKLGGVYKTASGQTFDVNAITQPLKQFGSKIADQVRMPFIQLRPFRMNPFGTNASEDLVQFSTRSSPFMEAGDQGATGYLWMKSARRRSGTVSRIDIDDMGLASSQQIKGRYMAINALRGKEAASARLAYGDTGRYSNQPQSKMGKALDFDPNQPDSLGNWTKRILKRKGDIRNPAELSRMYLDEGYDGLRRTHSAGDISEAFQDMFRFWRAQLVPKSLTRALRNGRGEQYSALRSMYQMGDENIMSMTPNKLLETAKRELNEEIPENLDRASTQLLSKARRNLLDKWTTTSRNLDETIRSKAGAYRVSDQLMLDLMRYNVIKSSTLKNVPFNRIMRNSMDEIEDMAQQGLIGRADAAQARTVMGSMNQIYTSIRSFRRDIDPTPNIRSVVDQMFGGEAAVGLQAQMNRVLRDTADYGTFGELSRRVKSVMGTSPYRFSGTEINPFGGPVTFLPTFGTSMARNPMRSLLSAAGITTWSDPTAFSTAGLLPSHLTNRMNDALGTFNMRVGTGRNYRGPLDLLARGMVGQRALPIMAGSAGIMAADRTIGGFVHNEQDAQGERIYKPLVTGAAATGLANLQVGIAGLMPGGQTAEEKRQELFEGEVPIRRGRYWLLGKTPWKGGQIDHFRPSWYRRFMQGAQYSSQQYGSPLERLLFHHDFSPLRPLDPYRYEREHAEDRPYPVSGDYFTGPWGPITPLLNMTAGRFLKPPKMMNEEQLALGLSEYVPVGQYGMAPGGISGGGGASGLSTGGATMGGYGVSVPGITGTAEALGAVGAPAYPSGSVRASQDLRNINSVYEGAAYSPNTVAMRQHMNRPMPPSHAAPTNVVNAVPPSNPSTLGSQFKELSYRSQEFAGIYGFAFGGVREALGFGEMEYETPDPVLASASAAYSSTRSFWDLGIGGLGDFPTPLEGEYANLEASEIVRRFIPKPRDQNTINPIRNTMPEWLPGNNYFMNFQTGDPFTKVAMGELRLPGQGYERFNELHSDSYGRYGLVDRLKILGDVAPYSAEFSQVASELRGRGMNPEEQQIYQETMRRVELKKRKHEFHDYQHKDDPISFGGVVEWMKHRDTWVNNKFFPYRTAIEDWERNNVYGTSFPEWGSPYESFIKPMAQKAADRNPVLGAASFATLGHLAGVSPQARAVGRVLGAVVGGGISAASNIREGVTGERFVPRDYKRAVAIQEYTDILEYTRSLRGRELARQAGDQTTAQYFQQAMRRTMYGADLQNMNLAELRQAVPKAKQEHFERFLMEGDPEDRQRILETSGRLERRIYQAAWGMQVEARPELDDYFASRELPGPEWEGWSPTVNMEHIQIKMLQQQGLNMSQLGYYPQQLQEANLMNPSYPNFNQPTADPAGEIRRLMELNGTPGHVRAVRTPFPGVNVEVMSG